MSDATSLQEVGKAEAAADRVLFLDPSELRSKFCRMPFSFLHSLAESGLFTLASLEQAADVLLSSGRGHRVLVRDAQTGVATRFADIQARRSTSDIFRCLETDDAWVGINNFADINKRYSALIESVVSEVLSLSGQSALIDVTRAQFSIFAASPHSVTPYHIDHEANFLCQVLGEKDVYLFPPDDRDVLPEREIESFYSGKINAASYRPELDSRGDMFRLRPGEGVHHPPLSPHWVKNGPQVSISVSINLCMRHIDDRAHVYQVNHLLGKLGLSPTPTGKSPRGDYIKSRAMGAICMSNPESTSDIVFSGFRRVMAPVGFARKIRSRIAPPRIS